MHCSTPNRKGTCPEYDNKVVNWIGAWIYKVLPLVHVLVSYDTDGIINSTIVFVMSRWLKWGATWFIWSCDAIGSGVSVIWCWQHCKCHLCNHYDKMIKMRCISTFWSCDAGVAYCDVDGSINSTILFFRSRQWKWGATWLSWSYDSIGPSVCLTWYWQHCL